MIQRVVFQCEHCKANRRKPKIYFTADRMCYHEHGCYYNIANKTCFTCKHNNRHYNTLVEKYIGCDLDLLPDNSDIWMLSELIQKDCKGWEAKNE